MALDRILAELRAERDRLDNAIAALKQTSGKRFRTGRGRRRRHMSAAARRRISLMMKRRWAERKKKQKTT